MYAIIAFIPIIVTVIVMAGFNWPAKIALPIGMAAHSNWSVLPHGRWTSSRSPLRRLQVS